jgi:amino acid adenylation domain-containing protein/non-ribosomal peptide synthase protein (TIGR01720 family)
MLGDAGVELVLTDAGRAEELGGGWRVLEVGEMDGELSRWPSSRVESGVGPENLAYVIYTSGSTGRPKGVAMPHRPLANLVAWQLRACPGPARTAQLASTGFDVSFQEILSTLASGGTLVIFSDEVRQDPDALRSGLARERVQRLFLPFVALRQLAGAGAPAPAALTEVVTAGEQLRVDDVLRRWLEGRTLRNQYGPTECHVVTEHVLAGPAEAWRDLPPIGRPIDGATCHVLDAWLDQSPVGVPGELFLGGRALARGYLARPDLTAERFVPNPFSPVPGARLYRTGDLGRLLPDGAVAYLGRADDQLKIRGFRVEPGEVESVLRGHPAIADVVVDARGASATDRRLVAWVTCRPGGRPTVSELRAFCRGLLPEHMVPAVYAFVEALPRTASGKVDRRALTAPDGDRPELAQPFVEPRTPAELLLASIWRDVLRRDRVGVHDNFFDLGGDSIISIQIVARANQAGFRLTPRDIFQRQTVAELATAGPGRTIRAEQGPVTGPIPLTPVQRWFAEQRPPDPHHWNMALTLELKRPLDADLLHRALQHVYDHHDALRSRFTRSGGDWTQVGGEPGPTAPPAVLDLCGLGADEQDRRMIATSARLQAAIDLAEGRLLRAALYDLGRDRAGQLLLFAHHLVVDMVSWRVLVEDLESAYLQLESGGAAHLPPKTTSYRAWARLLADHAQSADARRDAAYWLDLRGARTARLPVDGDGDGDSRGTSRTVTATLEPEETSRLLRFAGRGGEHADDVLLTALCLGLAGWTGVPGVFVNLEGHGREAIFDDVDLSRTVGWFTSIAPVHLDVGRSGPEVALARVREQLRAVPRHGIGYGILRYLSRDPDIVARLRSLPDPEVTFNYLGQLDASFGGSSLFAPRPAAERHAASPRNPRLGRLYVNGLVVRDTLRVSFSYSEVHHHRDTIQALADDFASCLRALLPGGRHD